MHPLLHRLLALFCLMAYMAGASPLLGALVGMAGASDASHELVVIASDEGEKIVLHHRTEVGRGISHHRGWLCDQMVAACSTDPQGDHVFQARHGGSQRLEVQHAFRVVQGPELPVAILPREMLVTPAEFAGTPAGNAGDPLVPDDGAWGGHWTTVRLLL